MRKLTIGSAIAVFAACGAPQPAGVATTGGAGARASDAAQPAAPSPSASNAPDAGSPADAPSAWLDAVAPTSTSSAAPAMAAACVVPDGPALPPTCPQGAVPARTAELAVALASSARSLRPDVAIPFEIDVKNLSDHAVLVHILQPQMADVEVRDARGVLVSPQPPPSGPLPAPCSLADYPMPAPGAALPPLSVVLAPGGVARLPFFWQASVIGWIGACTFFRAIAGPLPAGRYALRESIFATDGDVRATANVEVSPSAPLPANAVVGSQTLVLPIPLPLDGGPFL